MSEVLQLSLKGKSTAAKHYKTISFICGIKKLKLVNITKNKQSHRYREYTSGYQRGREQRGGTKVGRGSHRYPAMYIRIHWTAREYSQYCVGAINFKIVNHYAVPL